MISSHTRSDTRGSWTAKMDEQVKEAIKNHDEESTDPFPKNPFGSALPFSTLKHYLPDSELDKSAKQIRERWVGHICEQLRCSAVLEEDRDMVWSLCQKRKGKWSKVSKESFKIFGEKQYYSENAIKNLYFREVRKNSRISSSAIGQNNLKRKAFSLESQPGSQAPRVDRVAISPLTVTASLTPSHSRAGVASKSFGNTNIVGGENSDKRRKYSPDPSKVNQAVFNPSIFMANVVKRSIPQAQAGNFPVNKQIDQPVETTTNSLRPERMLKYPDILGCGELSKLFW